MLIFRIILSKPGRIGVRRSVRRWSAKWQNALRNEVPEVFVPDEVLERMRAAGLHGPEVGRELARELILAAQRKLSGVLLTAETSVEQMVELLRSLPA